MLKVLNAYSRDPDDPEKAVREILDQLDRGGGLLCNSVGLVFCHVDFIHLGVVEALGKSLPCELAGVSSQCIAVPGAEDEILLSLMVLTSDDNAFALGLSAPFAEDVEDAEALVEAAYVTAAAALPGEPSLIFSLQPTILNRGGKFIVDALDRVSGGVPIFGTCAMDAEIKLRNPLTIFHGSAYRDRTVVLLISGPVRPRFFSFRYPDTALLALDATVTEARDNLILSIDGKPAASYLSKIGISGEEDYDILFVIPLMIDYGGGAEPDIVIMSGVTPEGALICSHQIMTGGTLNIGSTSADFVLRTAESLAWAVKDEESRSDAAPEAPDYTALFIFSCFSRNVALGDPMDEIKVIQRELRDFSASYVFCYSGGEICPQYIDNIDTAADTGPGVTVNHFYQYALVACLL